MLGIYEVESLLLIGIESKTKILEPNKSAQIEDIKDYTGIHFLYYDLFHPINYTGFRTRG
jgi:hypothetical protein